MADIPTTPTPDHPTGTPVGGGRVAHWLGVAFYTGVAAVALAGQTTAAVGWLHWPGEFALPAVALLELGGIALAARSDYRRQLGERAYPARTLSTAVAVFAVAFNWAGHTDHLAGGFFAGMSALGYCVWLINAGDRRRDQLRRDGRLAQPAPAYGVIQWLRHPALTRRARLLALADPGLDLHGSLAKAAADARRERREAAISVLLAQKVGAGEDPVIAEIARNVYDLDQIAARLRDGADYDRLAALIAVDLEPDRVLGDQPTGRPRKPVDPAKPTSTDRPATPKATDRQPTGKPTTRKVSTRPVRRPGERAAIANARQLRQLYPTGLPDSGRQIRIRTGWSKDRVDEAVAAYQAKEDLADRDDKEEVRSA